MTDSRTFNGKIEVGDRGDFQRSVYADHATSNDLLASLKRLLLEFDFMIEAGTIPDVRDDVIFVDARAAVTKAERVPGVDLVSCPKCGLYANVAGLPDATRLQCGGCGHEYSKAGAQ